MSFKKGACIKNHWFIPCEQWLSQPPGAMGRKWIVLEYDCVSCGERKQERIEVTKMDAIEVKEMAKSLGFTDILPF